MTTKDSQTTIILKNNPFYILGVSCRDDRRKIMSAVEDVSFMLDAEICREAQTSLITPSRRLSAEMDWFLDTDISLVKKQIDKGEKIDVEGLTSISKLNATIYNFSLSKETDSFGMGSSILEINNQFTTLNVADLTQKINDCRTIAKMAEVSETEVSVGLNKKIERIRGLISEKLQALDNLDYIQLVTIFAEKYIANEGFNDSGIISDVIDQYEIWARAELDIKEDNIRKRIEAIKNLDDDVELNNAVDELISLIKEWDMYAQPMQVNTAAKGMEDKNSNNIAIDIRALAIFLHNEKEKTELAIKLTEALKQYFAELPEVYEVVKKDEKTLQNLQQEKRELEEGKNLHRREDKTYTVQLKGDKVSIPPYCTCCMKPTTNKLPQHIEDGRGWLEMPICEECVKHIQGRELKIYLFLVCLMAIAIGGVSMMLLMKTEINGFVNFIIANIIAVVAYYLLSYIFRLRELPCEHSSRDKGVRIRQIRHRICDHADGKISTFVVKYTDFTFANWEYFYLFKKANKDQVTETRENDEKNTAKSMNIYTANDDHKSTLKTMFLVIGFILFVALVIWSMSYGGSSSHSSSSSYSSYSSSSLNSKKYPTPLPTHVASISTAEKFSQNVITGSDVYTDIVSIFPSMGIYMEGFSYYTEFVCECKTTSGATVWVHMTATEYKNNFDSDASTRVGTEYADEVTFSTSKRIRGTVKTADLVMDDLSSEIGVTKLIEFSSIE